MPSAPPPQTPRHNGGGVSRGGGGVQGQGEGGGRKNGGRPQVGTTGVAHLGLCCGGVPPDLVRQMDLSQGGAHDNPFEQGWSPEMHTNGLYPFALATFVLHVPVCVGGFGTRPWWLALLACGGAYWPLAFEPSAMKSRHPYYCGHPHCRGHPPSWVGIQNATSAHGILP